MTNGLVIGKFYPPHRGHKYLINCAAKRVDHLVVVVCHLAGQKIHGEQRAAWLREIHPNVEVRVVHDIEEDDNSEAWAKYTKEFLGYVPDYVFTSEDYGDAYCHHLGAKHIQVDKERLHVPISATKVRSNPLQHWKFLEPCVRAHFVKRICVVGAESTGTTTMARALAEHYQTAWVPEYGRVYSEAKLRAAEGNEWRTAEFVHIAETQNRMEDALAKQANKILICDTDAFATGLWHERYMNHVALEVEKLHQDRHYDLYLLTADDIPFVQDGTRDGEHIRHWMHKKFIEKLQKHGKPFITLTGCHEKRLAEAIGACDKLLQQNFFEQTITTKI